MAAVGGGREPAGRAPGADPRGKDRGARGGEENGGRVGGSLFEGEKVQLTIQSRAAARLDSARTERDAAMAAKEALEREKREWASSLDDLLEAKLQNEEESAEKIKELEEKVHCFCYRSLN